MLRCTQVTGWPRITALGTFHPVTGMATMTREELLLSQRALEQRGYRYFYIYGRDPDRWCLRARRHAMASAPGRAETVVEIRSVEDFRDLLEW